METLSFEIQLPSEETFLEFLLAREAEGIDSPLYECFKAWLPLDVEFCDGIACFYSTANGNTESIGEVQLTGWYEDVYEVEQAMWTILSRTGKEGQGFFTGEDWLTLFCTVNPTIYAAWLSARGPA